MNAEIQQVANRLVGTLYGDDALPYQTPQHLGDFKIEEVRRVQTFITQINAVLNALPGRCLKKPVKRCGSI